MTIEALAALPWFVGGLCADKLTSSYNKVWFRKVKDLGEGMWACLCIWRSARLPLQLRRPLSLAVLGIASIICVQQSSLLPL